MVSHCDDDVLSLMALGESVGSADEQHVASCLRCQSRLDQLAAVVGTARSLTPSDHVVAPPDSVWQAISLDLALGSDIAETPTEIGGRRRRMWLIAASAALVGVIVGGAAVAGLSAQRSNDAVVARAELSQMDESGRSGTAVITSDQVGNSLTVSVAGLQPIDGYYEVWMATADASTMVPIGTLVPGVQETFYLPAGMSFAEFPIVDVSVEHFDGDATHSAQSVVRGQLRT